MPTVQELYELWAGDSKLPEELTRSLEPRSTESRVDAFAALGPTPGRAIEELPLDGFAECAPVLKLGDPMVDTLRRTVDVWERDA